MWPDTFVSGFLVYPEQEGPYYADSAWLGISVFSHPERDEVKHRDSFRYMGQEV
ncbi:MULTISPECIES: hypothetical protein [Paenibacillus]|uniref:hypothetical protein n=1 Tax=Paenibacillus TaxID=44249 RepID=UPI0004AE47B6|nr:hypothetical protein [Paenibacillus massiliensis]